MASISVSFAAPTNTGGLPILSYTVTSTPGNITATSTGSPIVITGLIAGTTYTFTVHATNANGDGPESASSNAVTPIDVPGSPTNVVAIIPGVVVDPYYSNVVLLLHADGANGSTSIVDSSGTPKTVSTNGNAVISTTQSKFGGSSLVFGGVGDYLTIPYSSEFDFGLGNFTIETWIYRTGVNANTSRVWGANGDFFNNVDISINGSGQLSSYGTTDGTTWNAWAAHTIGLITANQWVHIAVVRNGGTVTAYINGTGVTLTSALGSSVLTNGAGGAAFRSIGGQTTPDRGLAGYIDDFRVTKGIARYTSTFTPPTAPFPDA